MRQQRRAHVACLAAVALAVAGCGTSESDRNPLKRPGLAPGAAIGGFTGAAAGGTASWGAGGMILGALFGSYLGQRVAEEGSRSQVGGPIRLGSIEICFQNACVPEEDSYRYSESTYESFLNEPVGSRTSWENPATGSHGTSTITHEFTRADGSQCKAFTQSVVLKAEQRNVDGAACRADDGTWNVVDVKPEPRK